MLMLVAPALFRPLPTRRMYHVVERLGTRIRGGFVVLAFLAGCASPKAIDRAMGEIRRHEEDKAIVTLRHDLAIHPEVHETRILLITLYANSGRLDLAQAEVKELQARSREGDPTPFLELGHAYELAHKFEEALAAYDEAAVYAPASPLGPREGGMRSARWGEADAALERLSEAERRGARDAEFLHTMGLVKLKLGDADGAREAYTRGASADTRRIECLLGLATLALKANDAAAALAAYEQVLSREPKFPAAELGRAWSLAKLGRVAEAERSLTRAEELGAPAANVAKQRAALRP